MPTRYPSPDHAEMVVNIDKMVANLERQQELFRELRVTIIRKEAKDMIEGRTIDWTKDLRNGLRRAYIKAVRGKKEIFEYRGDEYLTTYAKYLLEFLDSRLGS